MKTSSIVMDAFLAVIGLLLIIFPEPIIGLIVILLGIEAIANGIYGLIYVRKILPDFSFQRVVIIRSMVSIVVGLIAVVGRFRLAEGAWKALIVVLAIYFIVSSLLQMYALGKMRETEVDRKQFLFETIASIALAVVLFIIFASITTVVRIIGAVILIYAAVYFFIEWRSRPIMAEKVEVVDDISGTVE